MTTTPIRSICDDGKSDARLNVLYSPFRKREVNPQDWDSKMTYWKTSILNWCISCNNCVFSLLGLQSEFAWKERPPSCLTTVIEDLLRNGEVMRLEELLSKESSSTWSSWAFKSFVKTPFAWSFSKIKESLTQPSDFVDTKFVHLGAIKKHSEHILDQLRQPGDRSIFTLDEKKSMLGLFDDQNIQVLLHWLQLQNQASVRTVGGKTVVKVSTDKGPVTPISDGDLGLLRLQQTELVLTRTLEQLEREKLDTEKEARSHLRESRREAAKSCLRKKKVLEKCIDKKAAALENVHILLSRVKETESDGEILDAYKLGLAAIKLTLKDAGLSEDGVSNTMDEVKEVLEVHDEIQSAMSDPMVAGLDQDLEDELADILANTTIQTDTDEPKQDRFLQDLPEAPTHSPTADKTWAFTPRVAEKQQ